MPLGPSGIPKGKDVSSRPSEDGRNNVVILATVRDYDIGFLPAAFRLATLDLLTGTRDFSLALPWPALLLAEVGMTILLFSTSPNTSPRHASHVHELHPSQVYTLWCHSTTQEAACRNSSSDQLPRPEATITSRRRSRQYRPLPFRTHDFSFIIGWVINPVQS